MNLTSNINIWLNVQYLCSISCQNSVSHLHYSVSVSLRMWIIPSHFVCLLKYPTAAETKPERLERFMLGLNSTKLTTKHIWGYNKTQIIRLSDQCGILISQIKTKFNSSNNSDHKIWLHLILWMKRFKTDQDEKK